MNGISTASPRLVVFGEALIDFKSTGGLGFQGFVGGSPLNVAMAAARLGLPAALATRVSTDLFGEAIMAHLAANGIDVSLLERSSEPSTLAFVQTVNGDARYSFRNEGAADTRFNPPDSSVLPDTVQAIHLGSVALLYEPGASAIMRLSSARAARSVVHFDPNIRPSLIIDRAAHLTRFEAVLGFTGWLKLSTEDLEWLAPGEPEASAAGRWLERGPAAVVVTRGRDGCALYRAGQQPLVLPGQAVTVRDTVGAGDTFSGATIQSLLALGVTSRSGIARLTIDQLGWVLGRATRAAAINCTRQGCDPPTTAELDGRPGA